MKTQAIDLGYVPRPLQQKLHSSLRRFNVIVCHRRFGKTVFAINETIDQALRNPLKNPQYAYLAPTFGQAKRVAWTYFKEYALKIPGAEANEADLRIDIPRPNTGDRIRFMLLGAENPMALKGLYLDGCIMDEFGEMFPATWSEVIRPTLADRKGWAIFIGTPKGQNHFAEMFTEANKGEDKSRYAAIFRASETKILDQEELDSLKSEMSEDEYNQELECSFMAGLVGAYFGKEITALEKDGKFTDVPYAPEIPVETYWDLGMNDVTSIWFIQKHFGVFRVIDYWEAPDTSLEEWARKLKSQPYSYKKHYLPHDAKVREMGSGKSRMEVLEAHVGRRMVEVIPRVEDKLDSINQARLILPRCVFDFKKCEKGIKALKNYQRKWDSKLQVFSPKPLHNSASNGADAFQQFAMGVNEREHEYFSEQSIIEAETHYNPLNYGG